MNNTIRLVKGEARLTRAEYKKFNKCDTIMGDKNDPVELNKWSIEEKEEALKELSKYRCTYHKGNTYDIEEYALEYYTEDEDGEFIEGSDYDFAEDDENEPFIAE